jgi:hypothetical protein
MDWEICSLERTALAFPTLRRRVGPTQRPSLRDHCPIAPIVRRCSGDGAGLTLSACATSMISAFDAPPLPSVTLTLPVASACGAEAAGGGAVCRTLAVTSGASIFRGAGKTSTFATANGSPLTGKSRRGSIKRTVAIARIAAPFAAALVGRLRPAGSGTEAAPTKPSGSSSSSHTSVNALALNVSGSRINLVSAYSQSCAQDRPAAHTGAGGFRLIFSPDTSPATPSITRPKKHVRWPAI